MGKRACPVDGADARSAPLVDPRAVDGRQPRQRLHRRAVGARVAGGRPGREDPDRRRDGDKGYSGDGGPGVQAQLAGPKHLGMDRDDSVLIVDTENHVIRRYIPRDGRITRVVGTGGKGAGGRGRADPKRCS